MLDESGARVVMLVAPPGYGKTTLARQWAGTAERAGRLVPDDPCLRRRRRVRHGLDSVLASAAPTPPGDRKRVAAIAAVNARPEPLARAIVSIHRDLPTETLLVVDEYETAGTEEADTLLGYLVDELDIRFLVTTRTRPPWFTSRLTVYGEGVEIGVDALTMTDDEARAVLTWKTAPADEAQLLEVARGWPAVLGLAAMTAASDLPEDTLLPRALVRLPGDGAPGRRPGEGARGSGAPCSRLGGRHSRWHVSFWETEATPSSKTPCGGGSPSDSTISRSRSTRSFKSCWSPG